MKTSKPRFILSWQHEQIITCKILKCIQQFYCLRKIDNVVLNLLQDQRNSYINVIRNQDFQHNIKGIDLNNIKQKLIVFFHKITYVSQFCPLKRSRSSDNLVAMTTLASQTVISKHYSSLQGTSFLEKWPTPGLGQKMYKLSQRHAVAESKEAITDQWSFVKVSQKST